MAERDNNGPGTAAADGAAADGAEVGEDAPKGKSRFLMILIPLILLGVGGGGVVAYSQYMAITTMGYESPVEEEEGAEPVEYGEFMEMENLIINPDGSSGKRYLMVKIGLESDKAKALAEVTAKDVVVRDAILRNLSARTVEELASIEQRESLKDSLRAAINAILEEGEVTRLYFTQYVLQ